MLYYLKTTGILFLAAYLACFAIGAVQAFVFYGRQIPYPLLVLGFAAAGAGYGWFARKNAKLSAGGALLSMAMLYILSFAFSRLVYPLLEPGLFRVFDRVLADSARMELYFFYTGMLSFETFVIYTFALAAGYYTAQICRSRRLWTVVS